MQILDPPPYDLEIETLGYVSCPGWEKEESLKEGLGQDMRQLSTGERNSIISEGIARGSVLKRGLQVPSRMSYITSGFQYPKILNKSGVTPSDWAAFTTEVKSHASLSITQWTVTVMSGLSIFILGGVFFGGVTLIPAGIAGHRMRKEREHRNIRTADQCGVLAECVDRWNASFFNAKGLSVRIDVPGRADDMKYMDVASTKLFKYEHDSGFDVAGSYSSKKWASRNKKVIRYRTKEGRARTKAARKGRIVIIPIYQDMPPIRGP